MLLSLCAICASASVTAADGGSSKLAQAPSLVGGAISGRPDVCSLDANHWAYFVVGSDGALWWATQTGGSTSWSSWQSLGGYLTSSPSAVSKTAGTIEVYARGSDGALWQIFSTDSGANWYGWHSLDGQILPYTCPSVSFMPGTSRVDVFVTGTDNALWHRSWDSGWSGWTKDAYGGWLTSGPAAVSKTAGDLEVYARGTDGALWQIFSTDSGANWYGWHSLDGHILLGTSPSVSYRPGTTSVDVSVAGTDNALWIRSWVSGWSGWTKDPNGGYLNWSPTQFSPNANDVYIYVTGSDGYIWHTFYSQFGSWGWPWYGPNIGPL